MNRMTTDLYLTWKPISPVGFIHKDFVDDRKTGQTNTFCTIALYEIGHGILVF